MALRISYLIGTYGSDWWRDLAIERPLNSIQAQRTPVHEVLVRHEPEGNLADVRNGLAKEATGEYLCFVDADDELHPGFSTFMAQAPKGYGLLNPAVQFVTGRTRKPPRMFKERDLAKGNYLVIGTVMRADLFFKAGGFDPQWRAYEDWSLMRRIVSLGARILPVPRAVYVAHWRGDGRNNTVEKPKELMADISADFDKWAASR